MTRLTKCLVTHLYRLSPVWTFMWVVRFPRWLNALSHIWHLYGVDTAVWTRMWTFSCPDTLNTLSHMWHFNICMVCLPYGLSYACVAVHADWLNALSHMRHLYGLSPVWILLCTTSFVDVVNRLLQTGHSNGFSVEWLPPSAANSVLLHSVNVVSVTSISALTGWDSCSVQSASVLNSMKLLHIHNVTDSCTLAANAIACQCYGTHTNAFWLFLKMLRDMSIA